MKKTAAAVIAIMIVISSALILNMTLPGPSDSGTDESGFDSGQFTVESVTLEDGSIWVLYDTNPPGTPSEAYVSVSDTTGLTIIADFHGFWRGNTTLNGTLFDTISVPEMGSVVDDGKPALPRLTKYVEIPHGVDISFQITYTESETIGGYYVAPFQTPKLGFPNMTSPEFVMNETVYSTNTLYPSYNMTLNGELSSSPIIMRGRRLLEVNLYPVRFNPATGNLSVFSMIQARINYSSPAQIEPVDAAKWSEPFERLFEGFILNYKDWGNPNSVTDEVGLSHSYSAHSDYQLSEYPSDGAEYLIITDEAYRDQCEKLAAWKTRKGLLTQVNTTQEICQDPRDDALEIQEYIENAYYSWTPAPAYTLIFGDSDIIPCIYELQHPAKSGEYYVHGEEGKCQIATDLLYFTIEGVDYLPEIIYGRVSVDNEVDATTIVDKIISYETNPPMDPSADIFYENILASSAFIDREPVDNREDEPYIVTSEALVDYLDDIYNIHRCYTSNVNIDISSEKHDGSRGLEHLYWGSDAEDIEGNINEGRFLVFHIDHGLSMNFHFFMGNPAFGTFDGWVDPLYTTADTNLLSNSELLPLVLSLDCCNGWFDGETDQDGTGNSNLQYRETECLAEILTRLNVGGAIAVIGATRGSWNDPAADLAEGITQAFWPGLLPHLNNQPIYDMGSALVFGKIRVEERWHNDQSQENIDRKYSECTSHLFHLFGDPETPLWTSKPSELSVSFPISIGTAEPQKFVVKVTNKSSGEPVHYAKVCLQRDQEVYEVGYTNVLGQAVFNIQPLTAGVLNITTTKHNFKPNISEISIVESPATLTVIPPRSEVGLNVLLSLANFDEEYVDVYFETTQVLPDILAVGGSFNEPRQVPITEFGPVFVRAEGRSSGKVAVTLFTLLSDEQGPDPYIYSQWDRSTWHLAAPAPEDLYWNNPCIQLYNLDGSEAHSNNLEVLQTYRIEACIHNSVQQEIAIGSVVTFTWSHYGAGQRTWNLIGTDVIDVEHGVDEVAEVYWTPSKTGHCCLRVSVFHPRDESVANNIGQENTNVREIHSPGDVSFIVQNPLCRDTHYYLEVRQISNNSEDMSVWESRVRGLSLSALPMGHNTTLVLEVNAPTGTLIGEYRYFIVNVYFDGILVGGISTLAIKEELPVTPFPDPVVIALIVLSGIIALVIIIAACKRR